MKIFYSWQSDLSNPSNRGLIEKALENVAKKLRNDRTLDIEPSIDRDTFGVTGSPEIVKTIFEKIEQADIFVCDISIINSINASRPSPNPNILVELGYALKALGENRIIMVFNTAYGKIENLPFDLRGRRILPYYSPISVDDRATERKKLEVSLEQAIRSIRPRLSLDPEYIRAFQNETERAKHLAYEQPKLWEFLLTTELLQYKIQAIKEQYDEIINGLQYLKTIQSSNEEYFQFIQAKNEDIRKIAFILTNFATAITAAWGPKGKPGNALEIKKATDRLISACEAMIEWEKEMRSVKPPIIFKNIRDILQTSTFTMISETERVISELNELLQQPNQQGRFEITFTIRLPENLAENINSELGKISQLIATNPNKWTQA